MTVHVGDIQLLLMPDSRIRLILQNTKPEPLQVSAAVGEMPTPPAKTHPHDIV